MAARQCYGKLQNFIDNNYVEAHAIKYTPTYDPGVGEIIGEVPWSSRDDVENAVASAQEAYKKWKDVPIFQRLQHLVRLKILVEQRFDEIARVISQNVGKTLREARAEVRRTIEAIDAALGATHLAMSVRKVVNMEPTEPEIDMEMIREPVGVFTVLSPFNFPVMIPMWFIPFAITLGNTIVLKPSPLDPVPTAYFARLFAEAGYPPGVVNIVHGDADVAEALISHRDVKGVAFVGSTAVGERVYAMAGQQGKRAIVQGSAKNPLIIMPDALVEPTVKSVVSGFFDMAGQRCLAPGLLLLVGDAYEKFLEPIMRETIGKRIGYQLLETTDIGPLNTSRSRERVMRMIDKAVEEGAKILVDGRRVKVEREYEGGFYLGPTLLGDVSPEMEIAQEEVFGPVMPIVRASSFEEALEIADTRKYGNTGVIYTSSGRYAREFARRMNAGNIAVNLAVAQPSQYFPFGGRKKSAFGALHAQMDALDFFTDRKIIVQRWF